MRPVLLCSSAPPSRSPPVVATTAPAPEKTPAATEAAAPTSAPSRPTCSTTRSGSRGDVATMKENAQQYHDLAEQSGFDTKKMLADNREEVAQLLADAKKTYVDANPAYEEMEGVVAGVPELADYDVIIDAGSDASDPESAVPFSIKTEDGKTYKQPGNLFFLIESALYGTEPKWSTKGDARRRRQGRVRRGAARPALLPRRDRRVRQAGQGARRLRQEVEADRAGRADRARGHDADDVGVLRGVEELALRGRRQGDREVVRRRLAPAGHRRHPRRPEADLRQRAAEDRRGQPRAGRADRPVAERARGVRRAPARPGGGRQEVHRRGRRHARPPRRRTRPRRSPARSPRPPSS